MELARNPKFSEMSDDTLATAWTNSVEELAHYKKAESELRDEIVARFFAGRVPESGAGTVNHEFVNGKLKAVFKRSYKVDAAKAEALFKSLEEKGDPLIAMVEQAIKYKPEFSMTGYKMLPAPLAARVDATLTYTDGKPSLEFVPAKA
ncbi:hypothetical protein Axy20_005 [Achromobacter phage vB_AxyS_19-32_Axy20]|nr:hypothetical protein Axy18_005 [Achromobacter phage vB_AxyS_19-32_Axy18]QDH84441.1 hypothetical protein Axy19_005 [Achromobacter phage vB_AxyS_19-32_Axy19]QDH84506.1 hypothetical protein Axy20_005 [Achromobacter phage vB_AxyS_19-32_Axy20]